MSRLPRSIQIAVLGVLVVVLAAFVVLRAHGAGAPSSAPTARSTGGTASSASAASTSHTPSRTASTASHTASSTSHAASSTSSGVASTSHPRSAPSRGDPVSTAKLQSVVEGELHSGQTVLVLFWNPGSTVDEAVKSQVAAAGRSLGGSVAIHYALPREVGSLGAVTRTIEVTQTPTLLVINPRGEVSTITGLTEAFTIEQVVREARGSKSKTG